MEALTDWKLRTRRAKAPRLAPAALNSVAPVPRDRFARARRNCIATPTLMGGSAVLRIESLSTVALSNIDEKGGGERWWGFQAQALCALPQERSGRGKEPSMRCDKCDPALDHRQVQGQPLHLLQTPDSSWPNERSTTRGSFALLRRRDCDKAASGSSRPVLSTRTTTPPCEE